MGSEIAAVGRPFMGGPGSHVLSKNQGDAISASWQCQNQGNANGFASIVILGFGLAASPLIQVTILPGQTVTLQGVAEVTGAPGSTVNGLLVMMDESSGGGGEIDRHLFSVNVATPPPPPAADLFSVGIPVIT